MQTLVTGANGFVGSALCKRLYGAGVPVRAAVRPDRQPLRNIETIVVRGLTAETDWSAALMDIQHVVHLAARVHVMMDQSLDPLAEFRRINVDGTINLARQAAAAGAKRFVFISSIKVNGESTLPGQPFSASDIPSPKDPYGMSKLETEQALRKVASETGMEVVIIRPPLVYGPGVKANFDSLMHWLEHRIPLPLAAITQNRRSLVALDNLIDLIITCLNHAAAANQTFLISDGEDLSTAELLKRIGHVLGKPARLFYVPTSLLRSGAALVKKEDIYQRLCGSLQVEIGKTRQLLDWTPPLSVDEGLRLAAQGLRA